MRRMMGECQAVVADAITTFGKIDILLCCTSQGMYPMLGQFYSLITA